MNRYLTASAVCLAGLCFCVVTLRGEAPTDARADAKAQAAAAKSPAGLRAALIGTWRMTSMKVNGEKSDLPDSSVTYKHVTPAGFTWLSYHKEDGQIFRAAGGTYTLSGDDYTENIEYGMSSDFNVIKNASHPFKCRIEGDTWHHTGHLANGTTIDEVWTRVKPGAAPADAQPAAAQP